MSTLLPKANPDFDVVYERVMDWWLEIDRNGQVTREIAFDQSGRAIAAAPLGENRGIFTDSTGAPESLGTIVAPEEFDKHWTEILARFRPGKPGAGLLAL